MANRDDINPLLDELQSLITAWRDRGETLEDIHAALDGKAGYVEGLIDDTEDDDDGEAEESRFKRSEHKLLERYLLRSGWKRQTYPNHIRRIYLDGDESGGEIELFFTDDARSADREIKLALNTLSQLCERSIASIISDVRSQFSS